MEDALSCNFCSKKVVKIHEAYKKATVAPKRYTVAFFNGIR